MIIFRDPPKKQLGDPSVDYKPHFGLLDVNNIKRSNEYPQGKGRTNAWSAQGRSSTSTIWPNTSDCTAAKSPSSAPSASSASLTPAPTANTWIIVTLTASRIENRSIPASWNENSLADLAKYVWSFFPSTTRDSAFNEEKANLKTGNNIIFRDKIKRLGTTLGERQVHLATNFSKRDLAHAFYPRKGLR